MWLFSSGRPGNEQAVSIYSTAYPRQSVHIHIYTWVHYTYKIKKDTLITFQLLYPYLWCLLPSAFYRSCSFIMFTVCLFLFLGHKLPQCKCVLLDTLLKRYQVYIGWLTESKGACLCRAQRLSDIFPRVPGYSFHWKSYSYHSNLMHNPLTAAWGGGCDVW